MSPRESTPMPWTWRLSSLTSTVPFRSAVGKTGRLTENPMHRVDAYQMIRLRMAEAGFKINLGCHVFRATGITAYLEAGGTLENAQAMAAHETARAAGGCGGNRPGRNSVPGRQQLFRSLEIREDPYRWRCRGDRPRHQPGQALSCQRRPLSEAVVRYWTLVPHFTRGAAHPGHIASD